jgi:hypothetical protein
VRIAVAIAAGAGDRVIACAAAFTHLAVNNGAIGILKRDFAGLLGDPARRQAGRPGHQPLDQAELEATPAGRHRAGAALDYLREQSRRIPRCLYALPGARPSGESLVVELAGHTWTTVMEASRHGRYDAVKRDAMAELTEHERGLRSTYGPVFNSLVAESWSGLTAGVGFQPEEIDVALARTELRWRPMPVDGTPDVADVQRLVDDAIAPAVAHVFESVGERPLVAHLTATDAVRTPEQAHARCMAVLAHHPTAISPRHYVICRTAPSDPADPAAWPAPLATGTGRA